VAIVIHFNLWKPPDVASPLQSFWSSRGRLYKFNTYATSFVLCDHDFRGVHIQGGSKK